MPSDEKMRDTGCPVAFALDTFGDRWTLLIIRDLLLKCKDSYSEFLDGDEAIATNILADRLKQLESAAIVEKSRDQENRRRFRYRLTQKGRELAPIILEMISWSARYDANTIVPKELVAKIETDRDGFIAELNARLDER